MDGFCFKFFVFLAIINHLLPSTTPFHFLLLFIHQITSNGYQGNLLPQSLLLLIDIIHHNLVINLIKHPHIQDGLFRIDVLELLFELVAIEVVPELVVEVTAI